MFDGEVLTRLLGDGKLAGYVGSWGKGDESGRMNPGGKQKDRGKSRPRRKFEGRESAIGKFRRREADGGGMAP